MAQQTVTNNHTLTAVDYLIEQLQAPCRGIPSHIIEQAKKMEKEQIEDAHIEGQRVFDKHPHTQWTNDQAEQYYNEIYKSK